MVFKMWETLRSFFITASRLLGLKWAPLDIPTSRRLQTLSVIVLMGLGAGEAVCLFLLFKLTYSDYWWLAIMYCMWMLYDIDISKRGGRKIDWVRNWPVFRYCRDYFPVTLVKTVDLDPSRNYLFACFPHGVIGSGAVLSFATNALDFYKIFPGMHSTLITLQINFLVPFFREFFLAMGFCSASKESLMHLLDLKRYRGKCVALVVGGAAEAIHAHPGDYTVVLNERKGFVRVAMESGAPLVPVFSFGEPDVFRPFSNPKESLMRRFQETVRKYTGISPVFPIGRGIFQYNYGFLPLRAPVTVVVGEPMEVQKNLEPSEEEVDRVHREFIKKLEELFEKEKHKYLKNPEEQHLVIT